MSRPGAIERWKAERGYEGRDYIPANSGRRRTAAKRALLGDMKAEDRRAGAANPNSTQNFSRSEYSFEHLVELTPALLWPG